MVVGLRADVLEIVRCEQLRQRRRLVVADLQGEPSAEMQRGLRDEALEQLQPARAAIQRGERIVADFAGELRDFGGVDVGEVRDDEAELAGDLREKIAAGKADALREAEPRGVFARQRQRGVGKVHRLYLRVRPLRGERERDHAAARADIEHALRFARREHDLAELLRLRARDERAFVAEERASVKLRGAEQMLERLARGAAFDQRAERLQLLIGERPVELQVQLHPFLPEHMGEQVLDVQARAFHAVLLKKRGRRLDDIEHSPHGAAASTPHPHNAQTPRGPHPEETAILPVPATAGVVAAMSMKVAICSGHMIDKPGRSEPRFPREKEAAVRAGIATQLAAWEIGSGDLAVCSGARGADILFAEECLARGARVRLLLAKEVDEFVEASVRLEDSDWVDRFHALRERCEVAILGETPGAGGGGDASQATDVYARTNLWIIDTARMEAPGAEAIFAILVWDEKPAGAGPGGTSDFASRVRALGGEIAIINPTRL